jgi:tRNA-dihydrouridine synthase
MKEVETAERVVRAMKEAAANLKQPILVKRRVGVDEHDNLDEFIRRLSQHSNIFYLHFRKCILGGQSKLRRFSAALR